MAKRKPSARSIRVTTDYRLFKRSDDNRPTERKSHKKLLQSMKAYGFLACFPIVCYRNGEKQLVVKDGQHRLLFAEELGLPVHWVEETIDFDVATVNSTPKIWKVKDYAEKFAQQGKADYQEGLEFSKVHGVPLGTAFALLAGTTTFSNTKDAFEDGNYVVKDREWAEAVATIYVPLVSMAPRIRNARFVAACMAACRVNGFQPKRLIQGGERCRDKLVPYSTRDAYLDMLETIYNFGRKSLVGLKAEALMAMKQRRPTPFKTQT